MVAAPTARLDSDSISSAPAPAVAPDSITEDIMIDISTTLPSNEVEEQIKEKSQEEDFAMDQDGLPKFAAVSNKMQKIKKETRSIAIPPHRFSPLRTSWNKIYLPLVDHLKLQVKMDIKNRKVLIRTCKSTVDPGAIQKGADFLRAFTLGFDIDDAVALLRLDDLYIETFEVKDVKTLSGDHLSRAIGRIAGKDGKTKFAIENASRTRVVLADSKIHILGGFTNIKIARETIVSLILGAPPGKVYGNLRIISSRMKERY
ncbi:Pno1p [Sugiyamaella lignohabitans]|uniref:Pre-rRNA-processing protein PNO1 n=1 Tax=Sugiyamaella lignohabitans TaxID=796027 RepID=A0A167FF19_9ASCO|nr:Pno1p [Sugiyamaella lignohabitans]ANB15218.1 Pno1p [Sugiyamaella lignohabitans]